MDRSKQTVEINYNEGWALIGACNVSIRALEKRMKAFQERLALASPGLEHDSLTSIVDGMKHTINQADAARSKLLATFDD